MREKPAKVGAPWISTLEGQSFKKNHGGKCGNWVGNMGQTNLDLTYVNKNMFILDQPSPSALPFFLNLLTN